MAMTPKEALVEYKQDQEFGYGQNIAASAVDIKKMAQQTEFGAPVPTIDVPKDLIDLKNAQRPAQSAVDKFVFAVPAAQQSPAEKAGRRLFGLFPALRSAQKPTNALTPEEQQEQRGPRPPSK